MLDSVRRCMRSGCVALTAVFLIQGSTQGQECGLFVRAGFAVPVSNPPPRDASSHDLGVGLGGGAGLSCGGAGILTYGGSVLAQSYGRVSALYLLGDGGLEWRFGGGSRSPMLRISGTAGLAGAAELANEPLGSGSARHTKLPSVGFALGGGAQVSFPSGGGAFFIDAKVLATFLGTEVVLPDAAGAVDDGFAGFVSIPMAIGYRFSL